MITGLYGQPCVERHTALIFDRGGSRRISQVVDLTLVEWARLLDRKSQGRVVITGRACREQADLLNAISPRRHELVLYRGGERVWEGPIMQVKTTSNFAEIIANDVIEYIDSRALSIKWPGPDGGGNPLMTERLREIINYELTNDYTVSTNDGDRLIPAWENVSPPANIVPFLDIRLGTTQTRASVEAFEMGLGEHVYNLGRSNGVNYTTVGRSLVIWDGSLGRTRVVSEKDFSGDFEVISSGADFFNGSHVIATSVAAGEAPSVGHAVNDMSYYGPWDNVISSSSEDPDSSAPAQSELNSQARRFLYGKYPVPIVLNAAQNSSLLTSPGLTMAQLVAGVEVPVVGTRNIRQLKQLQRLYGLKVSETSAGETINANLQAIGEIEEVL